MSNIHIQSIPQEILEQASSKANEMLAILKPFMITLTPVERADMLKMGDKSTSFVLKALEYSRTNPEFAPGYMVMSEFEVDVNDSQNLIPVLNVVSQLYNAIDDTKMVAGSEAYQSALLYYNGVQRAMDLNVPGAKAIYEELKIRFPSRAKKKEVPAV